ncbi:hypothetical protein LPJ63_004308 [Coemansia sp. RSA 2711]|nr:hypothetical protein LPJ63_004308 [Coemansia sp. RSA 2711]
MGFKQSRKLDDSPNNDRARGPKRQRLNICSSCNQPSEPQLPKGFPPVPPGYESRWQCWADSWRSRHEEARASDQVAFALEDAATVIDRLSAFEARANPDAPNAPFALAVEKALISVDSTEHIVTIMARAYENRVNANASFNEETASVKVNGLEAV